MLKTHKFHNKTRNHNAAENIIYSRHITKPGLMQYTPCATKTKGPNRK